MGAATATDIEDLSEGQAMGLWRDAWLGGKHGEWGDEPEIAAFPSKGGTWVLARVPMDWMEFDWQYDDNAPGPEKQRRAAAYAARSGRFPPGIATLSDRTLRHLTAEGRPVRAFVQDGNHRGLAAAIRGDVDYSVLMPRQDFERLVTARSGHGMRFGEGPPREDFKTMVARMKAEKRAVEQALLSAFERSPAVRLDRKGREPLLLILSGEMGPEGGYRISVLAQDGPYTHVIAPTVPGVVEELGRDLPVDLEAATPIGEDAVIA